MTSGSAASTAQARLMGRSVRPVSHASGTATATDDAVTTTARTTLLTRTASVLPRSATSKTSEGPASRERRIRYTSGRAMAAATRAAGTHTAAGGRTAVLRRGLLPVAIKHGPSRLEHPRLSEQLERPLQVVEVAEVHVRRLYLREGNQLLVDRVSFDERVLEGLV